VGTQRGEDMKGGDEDITRLHRCKVCGSMTDDPAHVCKECTERHELEGDD